MKRKNIHTQNMIHDRQGTETPATKNCETFRAVLNRNKILY